MINVRAMVCLLVAPRCRLEGYDRLEVRRFQDPSSGRAAADRTEKESGPAEGPGRGN
jgi:hypothetical protein